MHVMGSLPAQQCWYAKQCLINALKIGDTGKAQIDTIFPGYVNTISYDAKQY